MFFIPSSVPPSFTKPYYSGNYKINPNDDEQLTAENIIISEDYDDIESIVVTIVEEGKILLKL